MLEGPGAGSQVQKNFGGLLTPGGFLNLIPYGCFLNKPGDGQWGGKKGLGPSDKGRTGPQGPKPRQISHYKNPFSKKGSFCPRDWGADDMVTLLG